MIRASRDTTPSMVFPADTFQRTCREDLERKPRTPRVGQHSPMAQSQAVTITVDEARRVSGLLQVPRGARICYVLAHGAGAGIAHPFMAGVVDGLAERSIATMRYQFPYMEQGSKRPDAPKLAQATVRAAVSQASHMVPELALVAGGKSFGGRMTSQAQAALPLPGVHALVFLGFPLIPRDGHRTSVQLTCSR